MIERNRTRQTAPHRFTLAGARVLLALGLAVPAFAVDGVIEINQARALAGGVTPGDIPGFPVSISEPGSYRLTSDLQLSSVTVGSVISITVDNVVMDLNGFNVLCGPGGTADGITIANPDHVEIRNGTIRNCGRHGIFTNSGTHYIRVIGVSAIDNAFTGIELQGTVNFVDGCTAINNGLNGIRANDGSLVINSVAQSNTNLGLVLGATAGYRSNVLTENNGGNGNAQVASGLQLGANVCGFDLICP